MNKAIRAAVFERAATACEHCGCWVTPEDAHADHYFGRAKADETVANVWGLCVPCDHAKTNGQPSAAYWHIAYAAHCEKHGYAEAQERALAKLNALQVKHLAGAA